ncbi:MAG: RsmE family RNA methyltransferase, partial [Christensenellales bacterium]|nr:RsmE family RNA methyltransferase [Christensenellales bacterium]
LPRKLSAMKEELNALDVLIVPWEDARDGSIAQCLAPFADRESISVGILIGPEGGIAPEEAEWLVREAGAKLVTLGSRILRTETAAIASQTIVMALRGEME